VCQHISVVRAGPRVMCFTSSVASGSERKAIQQTILRNVMVRTSLTPDRPNERVWERRQDMFDK
jgi:hypothetical protein